MNKIASFIIKERIPFFLHFRHLSYERNLHFIVPTAISFIVYSRQNQQISLSSVRKMSIFEKIKAKANNLISDNIKVRAGGALAFERVADDVDYHEFIQHFQLPDTFQSWFLAMQLHVWLTISATISYRHGKSFRNSLVDAMWNDVELRMEKLAEMKASKRKKYLKDLVSEFQAGLIAYDEGILSDDTVLAAAAWRMLFTCKHIHPQLLEEAVLYIRKQLKHLESQNTDNIIFKGSVTFLPLNSIFSEDEMQLKITN